MVERRELIASPAGLEDGRREAGTVTKEEFRNKIGLRVKGDEKGLLAMEGMSDAVIAAVGGRAVYGCLGGGGEVRRVFN